MVSVTSDGFGRAVGSREGKTRADEVIGRKDGEWGGWEGVDVLDFWPRLPSKLQSRPRGGKGAVGDPNRYGSDTREGCGLRVFSYRIPKWLRCRRQSREPGAQSRRPS